MSSIPPNSPLLRGNYQKPKKKSSSGFWIILMIILIGGGIYGVKYKKQMDRDDEARKELQEEQEKLAAINAKKKQKEVEATKKKILAQHKAEEAAKQKAAALEAEKLAKKEAEEKALAEKQAKEKAKADAIATKEEERREAEEKERIAKENANIDAEMEEIFKQEAARRKAAIPVLKDPVTGINPVAKIEVYELHKRQKETKDKEVGTWKWEDVPKNEDSKNFPGKGKAMTGGERAPYLKLCQEALAEGVSKKKAVAAFYAAEDFPGIPEDGTPILERTLSIDPSVTGWQSTGLYAPPGATILVKAPKMLTGKTGNWQVRIGCHTDGLSVEKHDTWHRSPHLTSSKTLDKPRVEISNPFGGLIYIVNNSGSHKKPPVQVTIEGGVEAPLYKLGITTKSEWERQLATSKAPFGEVSCPRLVFTMTLEQLKQIPDVEAVTTSLQKNMQLQDWLSAFDSNPNNLTGPMRFVCDRQISAGAGHSGYPAMGTIDWGDSVATGSVIKSGSWGLWHELGHNHQRAPYRMEGMGEVTVNLFSVINQVVGCENPLYETRSLTPGDNEAAYSYIKSKDKFMDTEDVGVQLSFFAQLMQGLGFEAFRSASLKFEKNPYGDLSNEEKWDWLMMALSEASKKDLTEYFIIWKMPITESGIKKVKAKKFEAWLPAKNYPESLMSVE